MRIAAIAVMLAAVTPATAQWLPDEDQARYRKIWDATGVPFPDGGKFFALTRVSQRLVTINDVPSMGIYDRDYQGARNINRQDPWRTPVGLHASPTDQWATAKLAVFPGKIRVRQHVVQVLNEFGSYQPQWSIYWTFPAGTVFGEMLIRPGLSQAFEVRTRTKGADGWDAGITYRPWAEPPKGAVRRIVQRMDLGRVQSDPFDVKLHLLPDSMAGERPTRLHRTRTVVTTVTRNDALIPRGYMGHLTTCSACHSHAGEPTEYGATAVPGSDTIVSWHPFTMRTVNTDRLPHLDDRWPLDR